MKNPSAIKAFGTHLRALRDQRGLSQQQLADLSDVAKTTVNKIENNRLCPSMDILISISKGFGMSLGELTTFDLPKEKPIKKR